MKQKKYNIENSTSYEFRTVTVLYNIYTNNDEILTIFIFYGSNGSCAGLEVYLGNNKIADIEPNNNDNDKLFIYDSIASNEIDGSKLITELNKIIRKIKHLNTSTKLHNYPNHIINYEGCLITYQDLINIYTSIPDKIDKYSSLNARTIEANIYKYYGEKLKITTGIVINGCRYIMIEIINFYQMITLTMFLDYSLNKIYIKEYIYFQINNTLNSLLTGCATHLVKDYNKDSIKIFDDITKVYLNNAQRSGYQITDTRDENVDEFNPVFDELESIYVNSEVKSLNKVLLEEINRDLVNNRVWDIKLDN